jgi:predicted aconitase
MDLNSHQQDMLAGKEGKAIQKAMEILLALAKIYNAEALLPVRSVQIAGVSYDNLGEAGLEYLTELAENGGKVKAFTTLNPAGMDIENWQAMGISPEFAQQQIRVLNAFSRMGIVTTCTCTPYLVGNLPIFGEHIAWSESSAVCFANSVLGARTNREGGPSALAAALTGYTPAYGFHLDINRKPTLTVKIDCSLDGTDDFGALAEAISQKTASMPNKPVFWLEGIPYANLENLKSFCASLATYAGATLFHISGITPESSQYQPPKDDIVISLQDLNDAKQRLNTSKSGVIDFVSLGCPHLTLPEIARIAKMLEGKQVKKEFWITTARPVKQIADQMGFTRIIEASGARFATDTCCVVAPIKGRFQRLATDSAKACYYASGKNSIETVFLPFDDVIREALR